MPNWVQNKLFLRGEEKEVERLLQSLKGEHQRFDFNKVIPMPESLNITSGSVEKFSHEVYSYQVLGIQSDYLKRRYENHCTTAGNISIERYIDYLVESKQVDLELGKTAYDNLQQYGYMDWYDFCCTEWGCKWNASDVEIEGNGICFTTPWSAPIPVIEKLSEMFPTLTIRHIWSDEDMGANCGEVFYYDTCNGKAEYFPEDFTSDAYGLYMECWGDTDCIDQIGDEYIRKECEDCKICA